MVKEKYSFPHLPLGLIENILRREKHRDLSKIVSMTWSTKKIKNSKKQVSL